MLIEESIDSFIEECALKAHEFPIEIRRVLQRFKVNSNKEGYLLFKNLPISESHFNLASYGSLLGEVYGYIQEGGDQIFQDIQPKQNFENEISSQSSAIVLDFHTELVFHKFVPDYLLLFCIRGDRNQEADTYVSSIRESLSDISTKLKEVLRKPIFKTGIDHSFGNIETIKGNGKPVAILYGDSDDPLLNFDPDLMESMTEEGHIAMAQLREILWKNKSTVQLEAGDLLIIDNKRAVHGRSSFKAYYDGQDRYLNRTFVTRDLTRAQEVFEKKERNINYFF